MSYIELQQIEKQTLKIVRLYYNFQFEIVRDGEIKIDLFIHFQTTNIQFGTFKI